MIDHAQNFSNSPHTQSLHQFGIFLSAHMLLRAVNFINCRADKRGWEWHKGASAYSTGAISRLREKGSLYLVLPAHASAVVFLLQCIL